MTALRTIAIMSALAAMHLSAGAQTRSAAVASVKPALASSWTCATKKVEIAPVSYDAAGQADAWVMVHRVKGEIIASERVSRKEVDQIRRMPCQGDALERPEPLVG